jgi:hypothetical protein
LNVTGFADIAADDRGLATRPFNSSADDLSGIEIDLQDRHESSFARQDRRDPVADARPCPSSDNGDFPVQSAHGYSVPARRVTPTTVNPPSQQLDPEDFPPGRVSQHAAMLLGLLEGWC